MALSIADPEKHGVIGDLKYQIRVITFDSSYPTAGESLTPANVQLSDIIAVIDLGPAVASTPITRRVGLSYDDVNQKLQAYGSVASATEFEAEVANTTNLSTVINRVLILGK